MLLIAYSILFAQISANFLLLPKTNKSDNRRLMKRLNDILDKTYNNDVLVYVDTELRSNYPGFHYDTGHPTNIVQFEWMRATLFLIKAKLDIEKQFLILFQANFWNPRAKFLIITENHGEITKIFTSARKHFASNTIVMHGLDIYKNFPYQQENIRNPSVNYELIGAGDVWLLKTPKLWRNTTMRIAPFYLDDGRSLIYEMQIYKFIQSVLKFEFILTRYELGWGFTPATERPGYFALTQLVYEGSEDGTFGLIDYCIMNVSFTSNNLDISYPYIHDESVLLAPKARALNRSLGIVKVIESDLFISFYVATFALGFFYVIAWMVVSRDTSAPWKAFETFINTALLLPINDIPNYHTLRITFLIFWLLSFVMNAIFNGYFLTALMTVSYEKQISTIDDVIASPIKLGAVFKNPFEDPVSDVEQYLKKRFTICSDSLDCANRAAYHRDMVTLGPRKVADVLIPLTFIDESGVPLLYPFKKGFVRVFHGMFMTSGYPMHEQINMLIIRMKDAGFDIYFEGMNKFMVNLQAQLRIPNNLKTRPLSFLQLDTYFYVLLTGHLFAFITFCFECLHFKYWRKNQLRLNRHYLN